MRKKLEKNEGSKADGAFGPKSLRGGKMDEFYYDESSFSCTGCAKSSRKPGAKIAVERS